MTSFLEEEVLMSPDLYIELQLGPDNKIGEADIDIQKLEDDIPWE